MIRSRRWYRLWRCTWRAAAASVLEPECLRYVASVSKSWPPRRRSIFQEVTQLLLDEVGHELRSSSEPRNRGTPSATASATPSGVLGEVEGRRRLVQAVTDAGQDTRPGADGDLHLRGQRDITQVLEDAGSDRREGPAGRPGR